MAYVPDQGHLIWIDFNPSSGKEMMKRRPAFVISRELFNEHTGMAIVAPITSRVRGVRLEVVLPKTLSIQGAVLVYQLKSLDFMDRQAELIEIAPQTVIDQVLALAQVIVR